MTEFEEIVLNTIDTIAQQNPKKWAGSLYQQIMDLEIDPRGDVGEILLKEALEKLGHTVEHDRTTDPSKKAWDLLVDSEIMLEVKTATQGKNRNFQHENLSVHRGYHGLVLVDIGPDDIYMTFAPKTTLPFRRANNRWTKNPKKFHIRNDSRGKWDLTLKDVEDRKITTLEDLARHYNAMVKEIKGQTSAPPDQQQPPLLGRK